MKTRDFIRQHCACAEGAKWALSMSDDMADVWDAMIAEEKREWLIWTATRPKVFSDCKLRKLACRFVRETPLTDGRKVWDLLTDKRSRKAVEVAELYADGKATNEELKAASDAAHAASSVAYAAHAAAYAAHAAAYAAYVASSVAYAAHAAAYDATDAVYAAAYDATDAVYAAAYASDARAKAAQIKMIAEIGNPFKER